MRKTLYTTGTLIYVAFVMASAGWYIFNFVAKRGKHSEKIGVRSAFASMAKANSISNNLRTPLVNLIQREQPTERASPNRNTLLYQHHSEIASTMAKSRATRPSPIQSEWIRKWQAANSLNRTRGGSMKDLVPIERYTQDGIVVLGFPFIKAFEKSSLGFAT